MKTGFLSGNVLKVIAAISMTIDHIGLLFFPDVEILRILGRLALPIFAYMIAEGCRYTKNKLRYFSVMFFPAFIVQICAGIIEPESLYLCILITFSLSVMMIYALQYFKRMIFAKEKSFVKICFSGIVFALSIGMVWGMNKLFEIDYGFFGSLVPVFASLLQPVGKNDESVLSKIDSVVLHSVMTGLGLVLLSLNTGGDVQVYALAAIPLLMLYSGERGRVNMKYFFYAFYPIHLAVLGGIYLLVG